MTKKSKDKFMPSLADSALKMKLNAKKFKDRANFKKTQKLIQSVNRQSVRKKNK